MNECRRARPCKLSAEPGLSPGRVAVRQPSPALAAASPLQRLAGEQGGSTFPRHGVKAGATSRMNRSISSFTCPCGFMPTLK